MKILFVGEFIPYPSGEIPTEYFIAEALEKSGILVVRVDIRNISNYALTEQIVKGSKECDLVLFASGILALSLEDFGWACGQVKVPKILYTNDWIFLTEERKRVYLEKFPYVDLLITSDFEEYGIKQVRIPMACLPSYDFAPTFSNDLVFVGAVHYAEERKKFLDRIRDYFLVRLDIYGFCGNKDPVYGEKLEKVLQSYKIALGHNCISRRGYWSSRNYIVPGYGGFLLTPYVEGLEEEFEDKKHVVWWKDVEECIDLIKYYLKNEDEREKIRKEGYEFTQRVHSWDSRIKEFIRVFEEIR